MTRDEIERGLEGLADWLAGKYEQTGEVDYDTDAEIVEEAIALLKGEGETAVWKYYQNDEGRARWRCSNCGKICKRNPHDKRFCSICGRAMRMEG